jgi:hypothetical protein
VVPLEAGDTRFVIIEVPLLMDDEKIDWTETFQPQLTREAPAFLHTLLKMPTLPGAGRLYLPCLETPLKRKMLETLEFVPALLVEKLVEIIPKSGLKIERKELLEKLGDGCWKKSGISTNLKQVRPELADAGIWFEEKQRHIHFHWEAVEPQYGQSAAA